MNEPMISIIGSDIFIYLYTTQIGNGATVWILCTVKTIVWVVMRFFFRHSNSISISEEAITEWK